MQFDRFGRALRDAARKTRRLEAAAKQVGKVFFGLHDPPCRECGAKRGEPCWNKTEATLGRKAVRRKGAHAKRRCDFVKAVRA